MIVCAVHNMIPYAGRDTCHGPTYICENIAITYGCVLNDNKTH